MSAEEDSEAIRIVNHGAGFEASLALDPETRNWCLVAEGPASALLGFFMDCSEVSILRKLYEEASFDRIITYSLEP